MPQSGLTQEFFEQNIHYVTAGIKDEENPKIRSLASSVLCVWAERDEESQAPSIAHLNHHIFLADYLKLLSDPVHRIVSGVALDLTTFFEDFKLKQLPADLGSIV